MDNTLLLSMPGMSTEELMFIQSITKDFSEEKKKQFILLYKGKRKDPQEMMIFTAIGFLGFAGIQRFMTEEIGMGILYFLTWGLCGIGTIIDLVNSKKLAFDYNQKQAYEVINMTNMMGKSQY